MADKGDFFIGWAAKAPSADRRFFLASGVGLLAATGGMAYGLASHQQPVGPGTWDMADVREWRGTIISSPYPMLRTRDENGNVTTALLACMGKCAVKLRIDAMGERTVIVRGSPIRRGQHLMIATQDDGSWIELAGDTQAGDEELVWPTVERLGAVDLSGVILDTKCWFGAMRPGEGKVHKACASLCIRGGLPPGFYVKSLRDQRQLMILTDANGGPVSMDILPFVADPVQVVGEAVRQGTLVFVRMASPTPTRI
ncbi:MAG: hypothetical protein HRU11_06205 [Parvularculaceae bacterium]|nr:hypothetical protein [Parvularculaceae bacterium]